jgi:hypothetical protein
MFLVLVVPQQQSQMLQAWGLLLDLWGLLLQVLLLEVLLDLEE